MSVVDSLLSKINIIDFIREYTDLALDSKGVARGCCPIHKGDNPTSLAVYEDGYYYCFSCGSHGSSINFYADMEGLPFYQAIEGLAERFNIDLTGDKSYQDQKNLVKQNVLLAAKLHKEKNVVEEFLIKKRGLSSEIIDEFQIGYARDSNFVRSKAENSVFPGISFPIQDIYGRIVGFSKRRIDGDFKPTYVNSKDNTAFKKGSLLYNLNRARKRLKDTKKLYICEGYMDSISCHMQELAACAYIGGHLTNEQVLILKEINKIIPNLTFIFSPDNPYIDETGAKELPRIREKLLKYAPELNARVPILPNDCKDFNDCHVKGIKIGDLPTQHIDKAVLELSLSQCTDIENQYSIADSFMKSVKSELIKSDIISILADKWKQDISVVKKHFSVQVDNDDEILKEFCNIGDCEKDYLKMIENPGTTLGFASMDASFRPIRDKHVILIGAYSKVGKTDFMIELLLHSVVRLKMYCIVFTMEMSKESFYERIIYKLLNVNSDKLTDLMKTPEQCTLMAQVREKLEKYILINDKNGLSIDQIRERVQLLQSKHPDKKFSRVFVDYFQYMDKTGSYDEIKKSALSMKPFAKDLGLQLVMLSQFNREGNPWDEPSIRSFRGGNDMESSFDKAILLWRPGLKPGVEDTINGQELKYLTYAKIIDRDGLRGNSHFKLEYNPDTGRLSEKIS